VLQCVAVRCSEVQCAGVLQRVAVSCKARTSSLNSVLFKQDSLLFQLDIPKIRDSPNVWNSLFKVLVNIHVYTHICYNVCLCIYTYVCVRDRERQCVRVFIYLCIYVHMCIYIYIYIYIYVYS